MHAYDEVGPAEIGLLACMGLKTIPVVSRPVVAIMSTGDEIIDLMSSSSLGYGQIHDRLH